jgi:hypothetical protein
MGEDNEGEISFFSCVTRHRSPTPWQRDDRAARKNSKEQVKWVEWQDESASGTVIGVEYD